MLMATSKTSGGGEGGIETTLQFPLYIYFDYCEEEFGSTYCYVEGDFSELKRYITECCKAYGEYYEDSTMFDYYSYIIYEENISMVGKIYVEDGPVKMCAFLNIDDDTYVTIDTSNYSCEFYENGITAYVLN